jgi:hypothetical protein
MGALVYIALCLAPAASFRLLVSALERWSKSAGRERRRAVGPASDDDMCARFARDLHRLAAEHDRLASAEVPGRATRLRAVEMAYDDTLRIACQALDIDEPPAPWDGVTRVQAEAELVLHGVTW